MSFLHLSGGAVLAGALALAAAAFLLQRLKVRHREVLVPTTLFWREALEKSEARKLTERFRHPLAYALVLLILLLLWLALAGPRADGGRGAHVLLVVDGGAAMDRRVEDAGARGERLLDRALAKAGELAADLPAARRAVVLAGSPPRTLLGPGEPAELYAARVADLDPDAAPGRLAEELLVTLETHAAGHPGTFGAGEPLRVLVLGAPGLVLPPVADGDATLEAVDLGVTPAADDGLLALGLAPAASGAWDRVDLLVVTTGPTPAVTVDGVPVAPRVAAADDADGRATFEVADLVADGSTVRAAVAAAAGGPADASSLGDVAELVLPRRERLGVFVDPALPAAERGLLLGVLDADPGLDPAPAGEARVALLFAPPGPEPTAPGGLPALLVTEPADPATTPVLRARRPTADEDLPPFGPTFRALGLDRPGTDLSAGETPGAPVEVAPEPTLTEERGDGPALLAVDRRLLAPPYDLVEGRALPLLVGLGVRWLASTEELVPYALAGRDLAVTGRDSLGLPPRPRRAGAFASPAHEGTLAAGLVADHLAPEAPPTALEPLEAGSLPGGGDADRGAPLLLLALLLLGLEWHLLRTRRIP